MQKVILMKGLPGSGKSTLSKSIIMDNPNIYKRICRDDLRSMFDNMVYSKENEKFVRHIRDVLILESLLKGKSIIVDDLNISNKNYMRIEEIVNKFNKDKNKKVKIEINELKTPLEECIKRDASRSKPIGEKVIRKLANSYQKDEPEYIKQDERLPKAIISDLDGTLALLNGRNPYEADDCDKDILNIPVANVIKNYAKMGFKIILFSGRFDTYYDKTIKWLNNNDIPFDIIKMRKSNDTRKDSVIKKEFFKELVENKYFIEFVLDDRNQVVDLWRRDLKLPCLQVYYGDF